jgi:hypothetical protein
MSECLANHPDAENESGSSALRMSCADAVRDLKKTANRSHGREKMAQC